MAIVQTRRLPPAGTSDNRFISEAINGAMSNVESLDARTTVLEAVTHREVLTAARTYYVDGTSGSDSNDGLSSGAGAFATCQKAIDVVAGLDTSIYSVTVNVAAGTYAEAFTFKDPLGAGACSLTGDISTPSNVVLAPGATAALAQDGGSRRWTFSGFKLAPTSTGHGLFLSGGGKLTINKLEFGAFAAGYAQIYNINQSTLVCSDYAISGGGCFAHMLVSYNSVIQANNITITISGTPAYSDSFVYQTTGGVARLNASTFAGTGATGKRYNINSNAVCETYGGATYLPGNAAGVTATGGQYV